MRWWNRAPQWLVHALPALALVAIVALRIASPPFLEAVRHQVFDLYQRRHPRPPSESRVRIVDLDDETLRRFGQWPWPRTQVAQLISRLHELGARVVTLDIVFAEADRTSPNQILPLWASDIESAALAQALQALPDHDAVLAKAISQAQVVTGFSMSAQPNTLVAARKASFAFSGDTPSPFVFEFPGIVPTLPELEQAAAGNGHFNLVGEHDGVVRRVPLFLRRGQDIYPSLVMETLRVIQGTSTYVIKSAGASGQFNFGEQTGITHVKIGHWVIPTDANGRVWVYYAKDDPKRWIPAWQVLEGNLPEADIKDAIVFIGTSASGLRDLRTTPLLALAPGIDVHAQLTEQILSGSFLLRPDWVDGAELLYLIVFGAALLLLLPRLGPIWCAGLGVMGIAGAMAASWYAFISLHWLVDAVMPSLAALIIYLLASLSSFLRTEMERRQVRQAFGRYLSPVLVDRLARQPDQLKLGGESRTMTILFADIRGFTTLSEKLDAQELTRFMNRFLTPMTGVILESGGTIDKYIGDCIMAFWNAPLDDPHQERHACEAALAMRKALFEWNAASSADYRVDLGIGINTGRCCVGNMGSEQRFDYSVLGDPVNLASRLEGQCKTYGVDVVVGSETVSGASSLLFAELDRITVKGKTQPVEVYALLADAQKAAQSSLDAWKKAHARLLEAYRRQQWDQAREALSVCERQAPQEFKLQTLYGIYRRRVQEYSVAPPGPDWNGVWAATQK